MAWRFGKSKIFLSFCLAFVTGVFAGPYINYWIMAIAAMVFLMLISVWWNDKRLVLAGFLGLAALVGAVRHQQSFPDNEDTLVKYYGKETEFEAVVIREPDVRSDKINLTVKPVEFNGNILLNIGRYPEYSYGDKLKVSGKVEEPFESEEFSYKDYLARYETYALMRFPKIKKIGQGEAGKTKAALLAVKHQFQSALAQVLPEPHNALAQGLILGAKRAIPEDLKNAMIAVGVSHIIVISGYNMSIITQNILKIRPWAGRRAAMILSFALILAFVIMSGADASVVRAAIMAMLAVIAMNIGRIYVSLNALVFVAALMVFQNPKILAFDIGFQLSFTATAGLIYLGPAFEKWLSRLPNILEFRKNLSATLAAQIFTLPLLIFYFDRLSIVSLLVNILILWTVPYAMFFALVTGLAGLLYLPLAKLLAAALWGILEYQIRVVEFFARAPFAEIAVSLPAAVIFIYYAALLWKLRRRPAQNLLIFSNENAREAKI